MRAQIILSLFLILGIVQVSCATKEMPLNLENNQYSCCSDNSKDCLFLAEIRLDDKWKANEYTHKSYSYPISRIRMVKLSNEEEVAKISLGCEKYSSAVIGKKHLERWINDELNRYEPGKNEEVLDGQTVTIKGNEFKYFKVSIENRKTIMVTMSRILTRGNNIYVIMLGFSCPFESYDKINQVFINILNAIEFYDSV